MYKMQKYHSAAIEIGGRKFKAILADSLAKHIIGLMYRDRIGDNECMLFVFGGESSHLIWMHNMRFPIDAVWFDSDGKVVHIEEDMRPCRSIFKCRQYGAEAESKYVVEFSKGAVARNRISVKSRLDLELLNKKEGR